MAKPENYLLAAYIRGCLSTEQGAGFNFTARNNGVAGMSIDIRGGPSISTYAESLESRIQDYLTAHPTVAEIRGRTGMNGAGIESANLHFFDAEGNQLKEPGMVWLEYRQKSTGIVVTEEMLKQLEGSSL